MITTKHDAEFVKDTFPDFIKDTTKLNVWQLTAINALIYEARNFETKKLDSIVDIAMSGRVIEAIKEYRSYSGNSLIDSKHWVEARMEEIMNKKEN